MNLYRCHSDTAQCIVIDEEGNRTLHPWRAERGELYVSDLDYFPRHGLIWLIPTTGTKGNRTQRKLAKIRIEIPALIFRRCFEKASNIWRLDGG